MIFSCFTRMSFQNVHQPLWTVYNDLYPVAPYCIKKQPLWARTSLRLAFHPKCALSARKCIAQYRLKFQIIHSIFFSGSAPVYVCVSLMDCKYNKIYALAGDLMAYNKSTANDVATSYFLIV